MKGRLLATLVGGFIGTILMGGAVLLPADAAKKPVLSFTTARGGDTPVQPLDVATTTVPCPGGYVASGYGVLLGANDLVYADPDPGGRSYEFAFANSSSFSTFDSAASLRCAKGARLRVRSSLSRRERRQAVADARRALRD